MAAASPHQVQAVTRQACDCLRQHASRSDPAWPHALLAVAQYAVAAADLHANCAAAATTPGAPADTASAASVDRTGNGTDRVCPQRYAEHGVPSAVCEAVVLVYNTAAAAADDDQAACGVRLPGAVAAASTAARHAVPASLAYRLLRLLACSDAVRSGVVPPAALQPLADRAAAIAMSSHTSISDHSGAHSAADNSSDSSGCRARLPAYTLARLVVCFARLRVAPAPHLVQQLLQALADTPAVFGSLDSASSVVWAVHRLKLTPPRYALC
jgi:hypothetical protein